MRDSDSTREPIRHGRKGRTLVTGSDPIDRTSFLVRLWAETGAPGRVVRGFIENVNTGNRTYFSDLELPAGLLRESAARLACDDRAPLA